MRWISCSPRTPRSSGWDARPGATRCHDELHATGVDTTRTPAYDAVAVPTAQEKQVAEAAAAGLTNAAVAHRMHLSPQTVEVRVTHVYRKLDISGRTELPRLLSPRDQGTAG